MALNAGSFYVGAGIGYANYTGDAIDDPLLVADQKLEDGSEFLNTFVGVELTDSLSVELGYAVFGQVDDRYLNDPAVISIIAPNDKESVDYQRIRLMGIYRFPINDKLDVLVSGGYAYFNFDRFFHGGFSPSDPDISVDQSVDKHGLEVGVGAEYHFTDSFALRGDVYQSLIDDYKVQTNALSLVLKF
ncbi:MAG: porin family protein [Opitutales bacterium]|nr:porin family protein [Opitutales bacterium]